ncbi:MAG TPA: MerR family transcriptional regulator [Balneolaceae bacterium]|nr:MerR family transcriptional regulator [Balneolaceae bacterium]
MNNFSISQIAQFSGIKPHTIRIWEQRYDALTPDRSEGNTRYYDGNQLRRLLNIVSLSGEEYKISELCRMPDERLFDLIRTTREKTPVNDPNEYFISQLIAAGMSYDEVYFEKLFSHCLIRYGMNDAYKQVIYPLLVRLGLMWASDDLPPAHEHFMSNIIKQKLLTATDSLPPASSASESWMLFLPENEFHEIGLLFANYLIRFTRRKVLYMGANVPLPSLSAAINSTLPDNLLLFLVHFDLPNNTKAYLKDLSTRFAKQNIFVSGNQKMVHKSAPAKNIHWLNSVDDLERHL